MQIPNAILIPEIIRLLDEGHTVTLRLRGYSMRPFLEDDRDVALLVKAGTVKVGPPYWRRYRHATMCFIVS